MAGYVIRPVVKDEAENFRELRLQALQTVPEAFASAYEEDRELSIDFFRNHIPEPGSDNVIFAAEVEGQLRGMIGFRRDHHLKMRHNGIIWGVYVDPELRGKGLGRALFKAILDHAHQVEGLRYVKLSVVTTNETALHLYQSAGFRIWGTEPAVLLVNGIYYDEHHMVYQL